MLTPRCHSRAATSLKAKANPWQSADGYTLRGAVRQAPFSSLPRAPPEVKVGRSRRCNLVSLNLRLSDGKCAIRKSVGLTACWPHSHWRTRTLVTSGVCNSHLVWGKRQVDAKAVSSASVFHQNRHVVDHRPCNQNQRPLIEKVARGNLHEFARRQTTQAPQLQAAS